MLALLLLDAQLTWSSIALVGVTAFDLETTRRHLEHGRWEVNPVSATYIESPAKTYVINGLATGGAIGYGAWAKKHPKYRKTWWIPIAVVGGFHLAGGTINVTFRR